MNSNQNGQSIIVFAEGLMGAVFEFVDSRAQVFGLVGKFGLLGGEHSDRVVRFFVPTGLPG
jgi:hypothetical protein